MNSYIFNFKTKKKQVFYLLFLFILLFISVDRLTFYIVKEISYNFYKSLQEKTNPTKISKTEKYFYDTLILGTSRTNQGIHPFYFKKHLGLNSYKNARGGNFFKYNYYFYLNFKKKYTIPKYLVYGLDYFIFEQESKILRMIKMNILFGNRRRKYKKMNHSFENNNFNPLANLSLLFRKKNDIDGFMSDYIEHLISNKKNKKIPLISNYVGIKQTISLDNQKEPLNWKKVTYVKYPGKEGKYLDLLLDELEKDNVKVFFVMIPDYIGTFKTNFEHELYESDLLLISKKHSNIKVLNYNSQKKFELSNPKLFKDGHYGSVNSHLSFFGAEIFNKKLCDNISDLIKNN